MVGLYRCALLFLTIVGLAPIEAQAQDKYPSRPLRIIVPFDAGSTADIVTRFVADALRPNFPQPVVIENKAGASAIIGSGEVARSAPDGYTLLLVSSTQTSNVSMFKSLPFDLIQDFAPVSMVIGGPMIFVAHPSTNVKSLSELVERMKKEPGKISFSSGGTGTPTFMAMERFQAEAGAKLLHVPFKASAAGFSAVLGGQVNIVAGGFAQSREHVQHGELIPLAVTTETRSPSYPDVPTFKELGYSDMSITTWWGFVAPKGTPEPIIKYLSEKFSEAAKSSALTSKVEPLGYITKGSTPEEYGQYLKDDIARNAEIMKRIGYQPQ